MKKISLIPIIVTISAVIIATGEITGAIEQVNSSYISLKRSLSNSYDYERLNQVKVGLNSEYVESHFSEPRVIREFTSEEDASIKVKHIYEDKYWLSLYIKNQELVAFLVIPTHEDFKPLVFKQPHPTLDTSLTTLNFEPEEYLILYGRTGHGFAETYELGRSFNYYQAYAGFLEGAQQPEKHKTKWIRLIEDIALLQQSGEESPQEEKLIADIRQLTYINFYGMGSLTLDELSKGFLSALELKSFSE